MKNITKLLMLLTLFFVGMSLSSCSDDDKDPDITIDLAKQITGTYVGDGTLTHPDINPLKFPGMKIIISRSSSDYVILRIVQADNTTLLENDVFNILQTSTKDFILRCETFPNTKVNIDKNGNISYTNPHISVRGETGYTLSFTGRIDKNL